MTNTKPYNKKKLIKSLDRIVTNVAKRGVFVVNKIDDSFCVQNYVSKAIVIDDIPIREVAEKICDIYNKNKKLRIESITKLRILVNRYHKYKTDILFYRNSMEIEKDSSKFEIFEARFYLAKDRYATAASRLVEF